MVGWKGARDLDAKISFDTDQGSNSIRMPRFKGDEQISGVATFGLRPKHDDIRYKIVINGVVGTTIQRYPPGGLHSAYESEKHTFLSTTLFDGFINASFMPNSKDCVTIPFRFALQDETTQQALPSIDSRAIARSWTDSFKPGFKGDFRITYAVSAQAYVGRKTLTSTTREFNFMPTSTPPPPIAAEDFPDEYVLRASKSLQHFRIGIVSQEPSPLALDVGKDSASTNIEFIIKLFRSHKGHTDFGELPRQILVQARLRTTTFVISEWRKPGMHTLKDVVSSKDTEIKQDRTHIQDYTMALKSWETKTNGSQDANDRPASSEEVFSKAVSFPFVFRGEQMLVPTFYFPFLSRRYAVDLSLTFNAQSASSMKLRLPLQVFYSSGA